MLAIKYNDGWDKPIRFDADKSGACLRSSGPDGSFDTTDDVTFDVHGEVDQSIPVSVE
jgi:hypothetical protein